MLPSVHGCGSCGRSSVGHQVRVGAGGQSEGTDPDPVLAYHVVHQGPFRISIPKFNFFAKYKVENFRVFLLRPNKTCEQRDTFLKQSTILLHSDVNLTKR